MSTQYEILEQLGRGGEGTVYTARKIGGDPNEIFVLKKRTCISLQEANEGLDEAYHTATVQSEYVVKYEKVFLEEFVDSGVKMWHLCILLEYCPRGDLGKLLSGPGASRALSRYSVDGHINPQTVKGWIYQLCKGVQALHQQGIVHRDLKCENIFLSKNDTIKIGDLGTATRLRKPATQVAGSTAYMSPEMMLGRPYTSKADIWSLGCIIYELATSTLLAMTRDVSLGEQASKGELDVGLLLETLPEDYNDVAPLLEHVLVPDPDMRWPIDLVLSLPFFRAFQPNSQSDPGAGVPHGPSSSSLLQSGEIKLRELQVDRIPEAAHVLMLAMNDDPRFLLCAPNDAERPKFLEFTLMPAFLKKIVKTGRMYGLQRGNRLIGVSTFIPPHVDKFYPSLGTMARLVTSHATSIKGLTKLGTVLNTAQDEFAKKFKRNCWKVIFMGVLPEYQGQGLGRTLLAPMLKAAQEDQTYCSLSTFQERGLDFWRRAGFDILQTLRIKTNSSHHLNCYMLIRSPDGLEETIRQSTRMRTNSSLGDVKTAVASVAAVDNRASRSGSVTGIPQPQPASSTLGAGVPAGMSGALGTSAAIFASVANVSLRDVSNSNRSLAPGPGPSGSRTPSPTSPAAASASSRQLPQTSGSLTSFGSVTSLAFDPTMRVDRVSPTNSSSGPSAPFLSSSATDSSSGPLAASSPLSASPSTSSGSSFSLSLSSPPNASSSVEVPTMLASSSSELSASASAPGSDASGSRSPRTRFAGLPPPPVPRSPRSADAAASSSSASPQRFLSASPSAGPPESHEPEAGSVGDHTHAGTSPRRGLVRENGSRSMSLSSGRSLRREAGSRSLLDGEKSDGSIEGVDHAVIDLSLDDGQPTAEGPNAEDSDDDP